MTTFRGGGWKKLVICCVLFCVNLSHNHWNLVRDMEMMCAPLGSTMCASCLDSELRYMDVFIRVFFSVMFWVKYGGMYRVSMNLRSLDWEKLMHELQVASVLCLCKFIICVLCKFMK